MSRRLRQTAERRQRRAMALQQSTAFRRNRIKSRALLAEVINGQDGIVRRCCHPFCRDIYPKCVLHMSEKCQEGVSCRWIHISGDEHACNYCYEHFTRGGALFPVVNRWRKEWKNGGAKVQPSIKCYIAEEVLPYWLKCDNCGKWRQEQVLPQDLKVYSCGFNVNACSESENPVVKRVLANGWFASQGTPVLLKNSPTMRFIGTEYFLDLVGISPTSDAAIMERLFPMSDRLLEVMKPFITPNEPDRALNIDPAAMDGGELEKFAEYKKNQGVYLVLRNLIVSLWSINPKQWVTPELCRPWVICRGLLRVWLVHEVPRVLRYLTQRGVVNFGLLPAPSKFFLTAVDPLSIVIIGAGISGLVAARQMQNLGCNVVLLEAKSHIGGRIVDTDEMGIMVGRGGQLITGIISNPFAVMCYQGDIQCRLLCDACPLLRENGAVVDHSTDKRVELHFNFLLDLVGCYQQSADKHDDRSLMDCMNDMHRLYLDRGGKPFSALEDEVLNFHISNLEYSCGASLTKVSSLHWSQNEHFSQFAGRHALVTSGCSGVINKLAETLDVHLEQRVVKVDCTGPDVAVYTDSGQLYRCDKVLVSVPLTVLKRGTIQFVPPLPPRKVKAIGAIGCGQLEKVALRFSSKFWSRIVEFTDYFGHVSSLDSPRGLFSIFYDFTPRRELPSGAVVDSPPYVLMCYLSGEAVDLIQLHSDDSLVALCMATLRKMFPDQDVPEPISYLVTRWSQDVDIGMAYSYVKTGASGVDYDALAESVDNKIFFSGEATNRQFPQTFTGAVVSGLREAYNILAQ